jgi:signal transduction histidine kinase
MRHDIAIGITTALLFFSLVALFCVLLIKLYIQKITNYSRLLFEKDLEFQKVLTSTVIETQEQVLQNISQDLHDDAGQQLTYINFQIEALRLDSDEYNNTLEPLSQTVQQLSVSVRNLSHSLSNQLLIGDDLLKAMEAEADRLQKTNRITVKFHLDDAVQRTFDANEKIVLYRIFQESINNILKHSKATTIDIHAGNDPFEIVITDNGKGFDLNGMKKNKPGFGLANMANRAEFIHYGFDIESQPGIGTTIRISQKN